MQTENVTPSTKKPVFIKRSREIFKFSKKPVGTELIGKYTGNRMRLITDQDTGEQKEITDVCLTLLDNSKVAVSMDAGLRVALSSADVKEGETILIRKLEQTIMPNGKDRLNQYEIEVAQ